MSPIHNHSLHAPLPQLRPLERFSRLFFFGVVAFSTYDVANKCSLIPTCKFCTEPVAKERIKDLEALLHQSFRSG